MAVVRVPGKVVNKANAYRIHRSATGKLWIAPSDEAKAYQASVAYYFFAQEKRSWLNGEPLQLSIRLVKQRHDVDCAKGIQDGIEQSRRILNDRQFRKITIEHVDGKTPAVEIEVSPL